MRAGLSSVGTRLTTLVSLIVQASPEDHNLASELFNLIPKWLEEETIRPNRPRSLAGLNSVEFGFQQYREGNVSAYKIVYSI